MGRTVNRKRRVSWALSVLLSASTLVNAAGGETVYTFGVIPQQSATKTAQAWTPLLDYISNESGIAIRFKTLKDIRSFETRVAAGEYDLVYINPQLYVRYSGPNAYSAIVKQKNAMLEGIIVVNRDSPAKTLKDLAGSSIAFPSPDAYAASIVVRNQLLVAGIDIAPHYVGSHDSVYRNVALGLYPAGGGIPRTLKSMDEATQNSLRILWTSPAYTPHAFAVHDRVPAKDREKIKRAFLTLTPASSDFLEKLQFGEFESAVDSDWNDVRAFESQLQNSNNSR